MIISSGISDIFGEPFKGRASCDYILRVDVHKCPPCKKETQPCIPLLFSSLNQMFRSSSKETRDLLTFEHRIKEEKILVR